MKNYIITAMDIPAIILAAGASRRLGRPKQLVEVAGKTMLYRTVSMVLTRYTPVIVVLGSNIETITNSLARLPIIIVNNLQWESGMSSSIRVGIQALPVLASGAAFFVCDQIALNEILIADLHKTICDHPQQIVACEYNGIRGVPTYFPAQYFASLQNLKGDQGAKHILKNRDIIALPFLDGNLDIDYPRDLFK
jgi:molybdenum cofactor cytidylyltransferase